MRAQSAKFYTVHLIVLIIALACLLMNGPMREGLPLDTDIEQRMAFILEHRMLWSGAWCVWMAAALGLFVFCAILADSLQSSLLRTIGLAWVGMGIAPDLIAEVIYAFVIPESIARGVDTGTIEVLEIAAMHLTGYLGNGLYNLGGLTLTGLAIQQGLIKAWVAAWGMLAWVLGLLLSVSVALGSLKAAELFTASSMLLSTLWMLIFAHKVLRS